MATRTSQKGGSWSDPTVWDTSPGDTDTVVIDTGHSVIMDVDHTGLTNGITVQVKGTLTSATSAGTFGFKTNGSIVIYDGGTIQLGTSAVVPLPYTTKFKIISAAGASILTTTGTGTGKFYAYCTPPSNMFCKLTEDAILGGTTLTVDTNLTADNWSNGDTVYIVPLSKGIASGVEKRVIDHITSTSIVITVGLTAAKAAGSYVVLASRNITLTGDVGYVVEPAGATGWYLGCEIDCNNSNGIRYLTSSTLAGVIHYTYSYAMRAPDSFTITDSVIINNSTYGCFQGGSMNIANSVIAGCYIGFTANNLKTTVTDSYFLANGIVANGNLNCSFDNCTFSSNADCFYTGANNIFSSCTFSYNTFCFRQESPVIVYDTAFSNTDYPFIYCSRVKMWGCTGTTITNDYYGVSELEAYDCTYGASVNNVFGYNSSDIRQEFEYAFCENYGGSDADYRAWTLGGKVTTDASTKPSGATRSYQHTVSSATYRCFSQRKYTIPAYQTIRLRAYLYKDRSMVYLPRVQIIDPWQDPIVSAGYSTLDEEIMTDSVTTWEQFLLTYTNPYSYPIEVLARAVGKNSVGTFWALIESCGDPGINRANKT